MSRPSPRQQQANRSNSSSSSSRGSSSAKPPRRQPQQPQQQQQPDTAPPGGEWLAKALASSGVASRRACIDLVKAGKVQVNGSTVTDPATKVDLSIDRLVVDGQRLGTAAAQTLCHFAVHKPAGYICSNVSKQPGRRAIDLLQPWLDSWQQRHKGQLPPRLFTVGRLDVATSGLLFVTNDGAWANQVIHPSADITKEYWVTMAQDPTPKQLQLLRAGTVIEGTHVVPKVVRVRQSSQQPTAAAAGAAGSGAQPRSGSSGGSSRRGSRSSGGSSSRSSSRAEGAGRCVLQLDVSEGKKHEVRLLVAAAGLELLQLKRVRVGGFVMPAGLKPGQYMDLSPAMRATVFKPTSK